MAFLATHKMPHTLGSQRLQSGPGGQHLRANLRRAAPRRGAPGRSRYVTGPLVAAQWRSDDREPWKPDDRLWQQVTRGKFTRDPEEHPLLLLAALASQTVETIGPVAAAAAKVAGAVFNKAVGTTEQGTVILSRPSRPAAPTAPVVTRQPAADSAPGSGRQLQAGFNRRQDSPDGFRTSAVSASAAQKLAASAAAAQKPAQPAPASKPASGTPAAVPVMRSSTGVKAMANSPAAPAAPRNAPTPTAAAAAAPQKAAPAPAAAAPQRPAPGSGPMAVPRTKPPPPGPGAAQPRMGPPPAAAAGQARPPPTAAPASGTQRIVRGPAKPAPMAPAPAARKPAPAPAPAAAAAAPSAPAPRPTGAPTKYEDILDVLNEAATMVASDQRYDPVRALLAAAPRDPAARANFARNLVQGIQQADKLQGGDVFVLARTLLVARMARMASQAMGMQGNGSANGSAAAPSDAKFVPAGQRTTEDRK